MIQATPTAINYQFPDDNNAVVLKRLKPASINLSLLANTIIRINQPSSEPVPEPAGYPSWAIALANMGIPPAYLMLVGSTLEAVGFAFILGFMVWGCQQVCRARRAIAVEFIAALFTGIIVAYLSSTGLPILFGRYVSPQLSYSCPASPSLTHSNVWRLMIWFRALAYWDNALSR